MGANYRWAVLPDPPSYAERQQRDRDEQAARAAAHEAEQAPLLALVDGQPSIFIRYGAPPASGRSTNAREGILEDGVSVYRAWMIPRGGLILDLRGMDVISSLCIANSGRPVYAVTGQVVGQGADHEPLLTTVQVRPMRDGMRVRALVD